MERKGDRADIVRDVSLGISGAALARFRGFCDRVLGIRIDEVPTEQSIFMRQNYSIVFCAVVLFLLTNGFYLVKNIIMKTMLPPRHDTALHDGRCVPGDAAFYDFL